MKKAWAVAAVLAAFVTGASAQIKGAGSTFAANLYGTWSMAMAKGTDNRVDYEPVGSGAGVKAVQDRRVDFAGSDKPLTRALLDQAELVQFPTAIGGVVMLTNLPGITTDKVKLDGEVLAGIYTGRIKQWNDPLLKALNPDLTMPALAIVPVVRADSSGTTFVLTSYLSKVSTQFKSSVGTATSINVAGAKGGKTPAEVAKLVGDTPGAIGYVDFAHTAELGIPTAQVKNRWGKMVSATRESLQLAMRAADWEKLQIDQDPTFEMDLTDAGCPACWPMATATYVLVPIKGRNANAFRVFDFFERALLQGDDSAAKEGYVPLPSRAKSAVALAMRRWNSSLDKAGVGKPQRRTEQEPTAGAIAVARL